MSAKAKARLRLVKGPDLIDRYDAALGAVGDRYDGLEDAVHALAALVKQRPALSVITHPRRARHEDEETKA